MSDFDSIKAPHAWKLSKRDALGLIALTLFIALRSWSIAIEHSATWDTIYHLDRAWMFVSGSLDSQTSLNDPPIGEVIVSLPYLIARAWVDEPRLDPLLQVIAVWKSVLMFPALLAGFCWARRLYNRQAGWLVALLIAFEPTLSAMIPSATLDSLALATIVPAAYIGFLYGQSPGWRRLIALALTTALALLCKHTAIVLLPIGALQMIFAFITRRRHNTKTPFFAHLVLGCLMGLFSLWTLTGFDISPGARSFADPNLPVIRLTNSSIPAGVYFRSLSDASLHAAIGHDGFLWGQISRHGWWYYYFVVGFYKVPVGILLLGVLAIFSRRLSRDEIGLLIPIACYAVFCITSTVAIGFRHALPLELFCLIGLGRIMSRGKTMRLVSWGIVVLTIVNVSGWHPNYLSFINMPREKVWMKISDSNLDWGQGLKQVRDWIEIKRASGESRPISLIYFGSPEVLAGERNLPRFVPPDVQTGVPTDFTGLLITTPIAVSGQYQEPKLPVGFQHLEPTEIIGESMLVFDLDDPRVRAAIENAPKRNE